MFDDLKEQATALVEERLEQAESTSAARLGLDNRCFAPAWVTEDVLIIREDRRAMWEYYGGLEYVDRRYVLVVGEYVIYSAEDDRIAEALERHREVGGV